MAGILEFAKTIHPFGGQGQAVPLTFAESAILLVAEKTPDGWCRGFCAGKEGWFPASYVKVLSKEEVMQKGIHPMSLAAIMYSSQWIAYGTSEDKIYYVNTRTQATTWEIPALSPPPSETAEEPPLSPTATTPAATAAYVEGTNGKGFPLRSERKRSVKHKKIKLRIVNGLTFAENGPQQEPLNPSATSYVDHFWSDKGDQTGFDIILEKHLNGKNSMKDTVDFMRERAVIEEQYAKALLKLSKSTLGDQDEGTIGKVWQSLKAELRHRSEAHSKFSDKLQKELEKSIFDFKESQKKVRKEHQQIMEKSRKQVQALDASIEKARVVIAGKPSKLKKQMSHSDAPVPTGLQLPRRRSAATTGDEMKRLEESYNQAQRKWTDNMINACQDYERHEFERSDFMKDQYLRYIDLCIAVDESSAETLSRVADAVDRVKKTADREYFIKLRGTGKLRPTDRVVEL